MRFKSIFAVLFGMFLFQSVFGIDKWNVMFVNLRDLSQTRDKNTGLTIQKSIIAQFQKQPGFNLVLSKTNIIVESYQKALDVGRSYKADIMLYGDYYIEGEDLVIVVDVFDVLENRLKMRKYYSGAVDLDIFDTIDSMSADMVQKIKEALPELTEESEIRIRQVRKNIYETEKISIKRMFYTRIGFYTEMGPKQMYKITGDTVNNQYSFPDYAAAMGLGSWFKFSSIPIGLMLRVWDIRFDLLMSGIYGVPQIAWQNSEYTYNNLPANIFLMQFSYYLPWFGNSLAISLGSFSLQKFKYIGYNTGKNEFEMWDNGGGGFGNDFSFGVIWNPNSDLELTVFVAPFLSNYYSYKNSDNSGVINGTNHQIFRRDFPALTLGGIYFFGNFGLEVKAFVDSYHYTEFMLDNYGVTNFSNNSSGATYLNVTAASVYAGFVYRVDFMK